MSPTTWLAELRRRGVLKVAAGYLAIGWLLLQAVSLLFQNFGAPAWALKAFTTVVVIGFPVACLLAWGLEFTSQGVRTAPPLASEAPATPRHSDTLFGLALLLILGLVGANVVHQWRTPMRSPAGADQASTPPAPAAAATSEVAPTTAARTAVDPDAPPSIAVLPFVDMSEERDQQYLGDGIAEELLNALASIEGLNVAARTSSFSFHGKDVGVKEIGDTLHVRHVLEGSVRRSGQKLRVTAQLIDVETGFHRYSQAYDREVKDIFDIQNEIAREIVNALKPKLGIGKDANLIRQGTSNLEAYNLWLKAHEWLRNPNPVAVDTALVQLQQAVALDPDYIAAWGDLAYVHAHKSVWAGDPVPSLLEAYRAAAIALAREPANVPALLVHAYVSMLVHHDAAAAARYMAEAREAGGDPSVWAYNNALLHSGPLGDYESALAALQEAESRDPLAPNVRLAQIEMNLAAGHVADAVAVADAAQPLLPGAPMLMLIAARAYIADGDIERAREHMEAARHTGVVNFPGFTLLRFAIDDGARDHADARALLEELLEKGVDGQSNACYVIGEGYKAIGDYDRAIEWWSRAVERHEPWSLSFMPARNRNHPVIGKDPRFLALLKRMGLEGGTAAGGGTSK